MRVSSTLYPREHLVLPVLRLIIIIFVCGYEDYAALQVFKKENHLWQWRLNESVHNCSCLKSLAWVSSGSMLLLHSCFSAFGHIFKILRPLLFSCTLLGVFHCVISASMIMSAICLSADPISTGPESKRGRVSLRSICWSTAPAL